MKSFVRFLSRLLFPLKCGFCNIVISGEEKYLLCDKCLNNVKFIGEDCCQKCGKVLITGYANLCSDCRMIEHHFDRAFSAVEYRDGVKSALIRYKFFGQKKGFDTLIALILTKVWKIGSVDLILPVPLHKEKMVQRGFNQSEEIARFVAKELGVRLNTSSLLRVKNTKSQSTLLRQERLNNTKTAFESFCSSQIEGKTLLLVDDIYTTGSTVSECARVLKKAGAEKVYVLTIASGRGR